MTRITIRIALALAIVAASNLAAQTVQGSSRLAGIVHDEAGGALPGVAITIRSPQMTGERTAVTDADGLFGFPTVPSGVYAVRAELDGFVAQERAEVGASRCPDRSLDHEHS